MPGQAGPWPTGSLAASEGSPPFTAWAPVSLLLQTEEEMYMRKKIQEPTGMVPPALWDTNPEGVTPPLRLLWATQFPAGLLPPRNMCVPLQRLFFCHLLNKSSHYSLKQVINPPTLWPEAHGPTSTTKGFWRESYLNCPCEGLFTFLDKPRVAAPGGSWFPALRGRLVWEQCRT